MSYSKKTSYKLICKSSFENDTVSRDDFTSLLEQFENDVYVPSFPDADEREELSDIVGRIKAPKSNEPSSFCVLAINDGCVVAGLVADWYKGCGFLEIIYIAVGEQYRKNHIGSELLDAGVKLIAESLQPQAVRYVVLEVEKPTIATVDIEAVNRLVVWDRWGAKRIPIPYFQPPLSEGKNVVDNLMLMVLPKYSSLTDGMVETEPLRHFLKDFYYSLNFQDSSYLDMMMFGINAAARDVSLGTSTQNVLNVVVAESIMEEETALLKNFVSCRHYFCRAGVFGPDDVGYDRYTSFERDLMNYSGQLSLPFHTVFAGSYRNVELVMPRYYSYSSEGITHIRLTGEKNADGSRKVCADVAVSLSYKTDKDEHGMADCIISMAISPAGNALFSDLDVIRLNQQFGSTQESYQASSEICMCYNGELYSLEDFLSSVVLGNKTHSDLRPLRSGLCRVDVGNNSLSVCATHVNVGSSLGFCDNIIKNKAINKLICGIALGIFDFNRMNIPEIMDTVRPFNETEDSFMIMSRGNLLKIEILDSEDAAALSEILISPYMLIPSVALAFNDLLLNKLKCYLDKSWPWIKLGKYRFELGRDYLSGIFQYPSEEAIVDVGNQQRSLTKRYNELERDMTTIENQVSKRSTLVMETLLAFLTLFQVNSFLFTIFDSSFLFYFISALIILFQLWRWHEIKG